MTGMDNMIPETLRELKHSLHVGKNGEFRVLVLSDTHGQPTALCAEKIALVNLLIEK